MTFLDIIKGIRFDFDDDSDILFALDRKKDAINKENRFLHHLLGPFDFNIVPGHKIVVTSSAQEYDLPAGFDLARAVYWQDEEAYPLPRCSPNEKYNLNGPDRYYLVGAHGIIAKVEQFRKIGIVPAPTYGDNLYVDYIPFPSDLSDDADVPLIPVQFHEMLQLGANLRLAASKNLTDLDKAWKERYSLFGRELINHICKDQRGQARSFRSKMVE